MTNFSNEMIFGWGRSLPGYAFHYSGFTVIEESSGFFEEYQNVDNQGFIHRRLFFSLLQEATRMATALLWPPLLSKGRHCRRHSMFRC